MLVYSAWHLMLLLMLYSMFSVSLLQRPDIEARALPTIPSSFGGWGRQHRHHGDPACEDDGILAGFDNSFVEKPLNLEKPEGHLVL